MIPCHGAAQRPVSLQDAALLRPERPSGVVTASACQASIDAQAAATDSSNRQHGKCLSHLLTLLRCTYPCLRNSTRVPTDIDELLWTLPLLSC